VVQGWECPWQQTGSRLTKKNTAFKCIEAFINTKFEGGRHKKRVRKI
jgi:ribose 5-phosphate isomerase B